MFGTATCLWCAKTCDLLQQLGVDYREHRIDDSQESLTLFRHLKADGVPVVLIGNRRIYGFDEVAIRAAIEAMKRESIGGMGKDDFDVPTSRGRRAMLAQR